MMQRVIQRGLAATLILTCATTASAQDCDRSCLNALVRQYLDGMLAHDPSRVPLAEHVRFSENNVPMQVGDGLWGTVTKVREVKINFADPHAGAAGYFGVVEESGSAAILGLRLQVVDRKITEVETIVARKAPDGSGFPDPDHFQNYAVFDQAAPAQSRSTREQLVTIANSYFDTLQQNDGTIYAPFAKDCDRVEDGVQTTNNKQRAGDSGNAGPTLGCEAQFKTGNFRFVTRVRDRRFPVVDEERQIVLVANLFDHTGAMRSVRLTNGQVAKIGKPFDAPFSFVNLEMFKIVDGKIKRVDAVLEEVPYSMKTAWPR